MVAAIKPLLRPYYISNFILGISYCICKLFKPLCEIAFGLKQGNAKDEPLEDFCGSLSMRDMQIYMFLGLVICIKTRKVATWHDFLSTTFLFCKVANIALFFFQNSATLGCYLFCCVAVFFLFEEPVYRGPENIVYFTDQTLDEALKTAKERRISWLIEFYTNASAQCVRLAPYFSEVSNSYSLSNLRFGKLDVHRFPKVAKKFNIQGGIMANHLPTVILFENGEPAIRRPALDANGKILNVAASVKNLILQFGLNDLYHRCKCDLKHHKKIE